MPSCGSVPGRMRLGTLLLLLCLAFGCQSPGRMILADVTVRPGGGLELRPTEAWHRIARSASNPPEVEHWTRHGVLLETLSFVGGLPEGRALRVTHRPTPAYLSFNAELGMEGVTALVAELYERDEGFEAFRLLNTEVAGFLGDDGYRFDFEFRDRHGLLWRGRAYAAIRDARLYMIHYDAAALHYFEDGLPGVEAMVRQAFVF